MHRGTFSPSHVPSSRLDYVVGLFSRRNPPEELQIPDQLAQQAGYKFGTQDFAGAFNTYAEAIDKIHTMCVVTPRGMRQRTPGERDLVILDGLNNSLGAALAVNPQLDVRKLVERTIGYMDQIADEAGEADTLYHDAIRNIDITYRLGTH